MNVLHSAGIVSHSLLSQKKWAKNNAGGTIQVRQLGSPSKTLNELPGDTAEFTSQTNKMTDTPRLSAQSTDVHSTRNLMGTFTWETIKQAHSFKGTFKTFSS